MSGSGLVAGKKWPVPVTYPEDDTHRRLIVEGLNELAAAAFTARTRLARLTGDVAFTDSWAELAELAITVTPFIPARAHGILFFHYENLSVANDLTTELRVLENGVEIHSRVLPVIPMTPTDPAWLSYPLQFLRDLEPNTDYAYTVEVIMDTGDDGQVLQPTSLTVRLEARILDP